MRRYAIATVLAGMALLTFGCGKPSQQAGTTPTGGAPEPPKIELRAAQPIDIPASVLPEGKVPVYLRVRDPQQTVARLGEWTSATQPTMTPQALAQNIEGAGVPLGKFEPGKNALAAVWPIPNDKMAGGILPVAPGTDLTPLGLQTQEVPGIGVLFGADNAGKGLQQAQSIKDDLVKMQQAPMSSDVEIGVDVKGQWAIYGPMARMMLPSMLASMQQAGPQMPQGIQAIINAYLAIGMDLLDQTKSVTLRANFDKEAVELSFALEGDAGTTLTAALGKDPVAAPELTQYLGKNQTVGQFEIRDMARLNETMIHYFAMMMPNEPDAAAKIREQFAGSEKIGAMHVGVGMTMAPDGPMRAEYVMVVDDPDALMQFMRKNMGMLNSGPLHDFYKSLDMEIGITTQPLTRQYKGLTIEGYKMSLKPGPNATEADRAMAAKMFPGDMPFECVQLGKYVLMSVGQKVDGVVDRLLSPEAGAPVEAVKAFPAGAMFYINYDVIGYMRGISEAMPNMSRLSLPENAPPLLVAGYHQQGKAYYILRIPRGFVTAIGRMNEAEAVATPAQ